MPNYEEEDNNYQYILVLLCAATLVLATASVYMMEVLSTNYGLGVGAVYQSIATKQSITANLTGVAAAASNLHNSIRESYLIALIAFGMLGSALVIYITRYRRHSAISRKYTLLHAAFTLIYIALFLVIMSSYQFDYTRPYFLITYAAMITAVAIDAYLEFGVQAPVRAPSTHRSGVRIEPNTPYSNLLKLRDTVFASLNGYVRVVDKNFNSDAISNFHRLMETNLQNIQKIDVITSTQTLDSKFNDNYVDFRNELKNKGVELNFMLMSDQDSIEQHERFVFDDKNAYKIPPLNIINKKSEHILNLRVAEARHRFDTIAKNAIKYDNYVVKQARNPGEA